MIYYNGECGKIDKNKGLHYLLQAAHQNNKYSQYMVGLVYLNENKINNTKRYFLSASNNNHRESQYILGIIYLTIESEKNIEKAMHYLNLSAKNELHFAHFYLGVIYSNNKYGKKNIELAIKHYKNASSYNNSNAKNNLAIIEINDTIFYSEELLTEAIKFKNQIAMFNLANIYIHKKITQNEKSLNPIELLVNSSKKLPLSKYLLCIVFMEKYKVLSNDIKVKIKEEIELIDKNNSGLADEICEMIIYKEMENNQNLKELYLFFENYYLFYYNSFEFTSFDIFMKESKESPIKNSLIKDITSEFYDGFYLN